MTDNIYLERGASPWSPTFDTTMMVELDRHDFPRIGVIRQDHVGRNVDFLFFCAAGEETDTNLWFYVSIDDVEAKTLASSYGPDVYREVARVFQHRWVTGAVASDFKIVWTDCLDAGMESMDALTGRFLDRFLSDMRKTEHEAEGLAREAKKDVELV